MEKARFQTRNSLRHSDFGKVIEQSTISDIELGTFLRLSEDFFFIRLYYPGNSFYATKIKKKF